MNNLIKVAVPAGIGDVSWIWSKLITIPDTKFQIFTPDTYPQRTFGWMKLLGDRVIPAIGKHGYNDILTNETLHDHEEYRSWKELLNNYTKEEVIYLQPNQWFLKGRLLSEWLPDLGTNFHYPIIIPEEDKLIATDLLSGSRYNIGIHMGCIRGSRAWNTWLPEDWANFIVELNNNFPKLRVVLLGGLWDLDMAMEVMGRLPDGVKVLDLIGRTSIAQAIAILDSLVYYVGFSSGLNVMMNVLNKPCTALWPKHQRDHIYPHADPQMIDERRYLGFVYDDPKRIVMRIKNIINKQLELTWED